MKIALVNGIRVTATPGQKGAVCPLCHTEVIAKCGEIIVHHWAHKRATSCDPWVEQDSEWRYQWLDCFSDCKQETVVVVKHEKHFADIETEHGTRILLHSASIKESVLKSMEEFFSNMLWIVDLGSFYKGFRTVSECYERSVYFS